MWKPVGDTEHRQIASMEHRMEVLTHGLDGPVPAVRKSPFRSSFFASYITLHTV